MEDIKDRGVSSVPQVKRAMSLSHLATPVTSMHTTNICSEACMTALDAFRFTTRVHSCQHLQKSPDIQRLNGKYDSLLAGSKWISCAPRLSVSSSQINTESTSNSENTGAASIKEIASNNLKKDNRFCNFQQNLNSINSVAKSSRGVCNKIIAEVTSRDFVSFQDSFSDIKGTEKISVVLADKHNDKCFKSETSLNVREPQPKDEKTDVHQAAQWIKDEEDYDRNNSKITEKKVKSNTSDMCKPKCKEASQRHKFTTNCSETSVIKSRALCGHMKHKQSGKHNLRNRDLDLSADACKVLNICKPTGKGNNKVSIKGHNVIKTSQGTIHKRLVERESKHDMETAVVVKGRRTDRALGIKRSSSMDSLRLQNAANTCREASIIRARESPQMSRHQPKILIFLLLFGLILNPILAPAGLYLLMRSQRAWSQKRYHRAYSLYNQAGGIAITGIVVTLTLLVSLILTIPRNQNDTARIPTTTSSYSQDSEVIRSAGERLLEKIRNESSSKMQNGKRTTQSRSSRRTASPRRSYTKVRHSFRRFGNIDINDIGRFMEQTPPTKTAETTRTKHLNEFLSKDVARGKPELKFGNRTMSVYFDPSTNATYVVNIPDFLQ